MLESASHHNPPKGSLAAYLTATLHTPVVLKPWKSDRALPVFITRHYNLAQAEIAGRTCVFMQVTDDRERTPKEYGKHIAQMGDDDDLIFVIAPMSMRPQTRSRLIEQGIAFAVPGNQLYIPHLAMDLREHFRTKEKAPVGRLSPAAQIVFFHHLLGRHDEATPSALARALPYTPMTLGRAFDELAQHGIARVERAGREKTITYPADRAVVLEHAKTLLRTPRRGYHAVRFKGGRPPLLRAGETALSDLTDLAPPATPVYAIDGHRWKETFDHNAIEDVYEIDAADAMIETWYYDPALLAEDGRVDRASLFAQYWNDADERIVQAAMDVLESFA